MRTDTRQEALEGCLAQQVRVTGIIQGGAGCFRTQALGLRVRVRLPQQCHEHSICDRYRLAAGHRPGTLQASYMATCGAGTQAGGTGGAGWVWRGLAGSQR